MVRTTGGGGGGGWWGRARHWAMMILALASARTALGQATTSPAPAHAPEDAGIDRTSFYTRAPDGAIVGPVNTGWWTDAVFYQVFVRSFADSTSGPLANDGIGDIRGLIEHLDYLNDARVSEKKPTSAKSLGVTGIWLMPMHPSPSYHGYDVTDYRGINPQYGTMDDFKELVKACHERGIKVVIDLVLNHSSDLHPWFQDALRGKLPEREYYLFQPENPGWKGPWKQTVWHPEVEQAVIGGKQRPGSGPFYYGLFSRHMPDLNYRNPEVTREMLDVVRFWLKDVGIDGLRLDAIRHLIEDGQKQENTPETHTWLQKYFKAVKEANPKAMSVGEVWTSSAIASSYVSDQLDLVFEFDQSFALVKSAQTGVARHAREARGKLSRFYPPNEFASFLTNHDQPRIATEVKGDAAALRAAASALLMGPGVPFVYYGEEIGLTGPKPDEKIRTPMPWSGTAFGGFSTVKPWQALNPDFPERNVADQIKDVDSLLSRYRTLIKLRQSQPALSRGGLVPVTATDAGIDAFLRTPPADAPDAPAALVLVNFGKSAATKIRLSLGEAELKGTGRKSSGLKASMTATDALEPGRRVSAPTIGAGAIGGFADYAPVEQIEAGGVRVILLK